MIYRFPSRGKPTPVGPPWPFGQWEVLLRAPFRGPGRSAISCSLLARAGWETQCPFFAGLQSSENRYVNWAFALERRGYLVTAPEMCWSGLRRYDRL